MVTHSVCHVWPQPLPPYVHRRAHQQALETYTNFVICSVTNPCAASAPPPHRLHTTSTPPLCLGTSTLGTPYARRLQALRTQAPPLRTQVIGGIRQPIMTTIAGCLYIVARVRWAKGYTTPGGDPMNRYRASGGWGMQRGL